VSTVGGGSDCGEGDSGGAARKPIGVHSDNPHYYLFHGKPTVLITSAEHYGAVVNEEFDYVAYLDALSSYGLNYTRIYPGYLFEPIGKFGKGNTLASNRRASLSRGRAAPCLVTHCPVINSISTGGTRSILSG